MAHVKKNHAQVDGIQEYIPSAEPARKRVKMACDRCRKRKVRCDGSQPCNHCREGHSACLYHPVVNSSGETPVQALDNDFSVHATSEQSLNEPQIDSLAVQTPPTTSACLGAGIPIDSTLPQEAGRCSLQTEAESRWRNPADGLEMTGTESNSFLGFDVSFASDDDLGNVTMTDFWQLPPLVRHYDHFTLARHTENVARTAKLGGKT